MRCHLGFGGFLLAAVVAFAPGSGFGQFPSRFGGGPPGFGGGPPGGGGGGPSMFMSADPNQRFDYYARGRNFFLINDTRMLRDPLTQWAKDNGVTNGQITREQFLAFSKSFSAKVADGSGAKLSFPGPGGGMPLQPPGTPATPPGAPAAPGQTPAVNPVDMLNQMAESEFKRRDNNADSVLNFDEMSDSLRGDLGRWDVNHDSLIDLAEYKGYFAYRMQRGGRDGAPSNAVTVIIEEELDRRPVVFRAGKLPKELPKWFQDLDADQDGQVSLFEWRKGGKEMDEFRPWDRNDDGLVSPEEALYQQTQAQAASTGKTAAPPAFTSRRGGDSPPAGPDGGFFSKFKKR